MAYDRRLSMSYRLAYRQRPPYPLSYCIAFLSLLTELLAPYFNEFIQVSFLQCTMIRPQLSSQSQLSARVRIG